MKHAIFHFGYPKTGTTYLQRKIFTQLSEQYFIVTPEFENLGINIKSFRKSVQDGHGTLKGIDQVRTKPFLLSMEGFLFDAMRYVHENEFRPTNFEHAQQGMRALCDEADPEKISIVIYLRRQDQLIHSLYAESYTFYFRFVEDFNTLEKYSEAVMASAASKEHCGFYYDYTNTINSIRKNWPDSSIHVRFYENLSENPASEIDFWQNLTGEKIQHIKGRDNVRQSAKDEKKADANSIRVQAVHLKNKYLPNLKLPNKASQFAKKALSSVQFGEADTIIMDDPLRNKIRNHFLEINKKLVKSVPEISDDIPDSYLDPSLS